MYLVADNDYVGIENSMVLLDPEVNNVPVPVNITDDNDLEPNEQLILDLELITTSQAVSVEVNYIPIVIIDDDCKLVCLWRGPSKAHYFVYHLKAL